MTAHDDLLDYYQRELNYLRSAGIDFARSYPKIARRLEIGPDQSTDPNVERLIESFAFLTGRVQRNLEAELPRLTTALLGILQPQLAAPTPPLAIARFEVDPAQGKLTTGFTLPRHTPLFTATADDVICRFRTCYDVTLWPIRVTQAQIESPDQHEFLDSGNVAAVLRLRLKAEGSHFAELEADRLRFHINAGAILANTLYELVFAGVEEVAYLEADGTRHVLPHEQAIRPVGYEPEEAVLPGADRSHPGYRLLSEYFVFPEKFRFFDLRLPKFSHAGQEVDVLLLLTRQPRQRMAIEPDMFALGCAPVANLFTRLVEPVHLDQRLTEYRLVGDYRRERTTEVHSILSVAGITAASGERTEFQPIFSFDHVSAQQDAKAFWAIHREPSGRADLPGTETYLTFLDLTAAPSLPPVQTVLVEALCTNRVLAEQVPAGARLSVERGAPLQRITLLGKPTPPKPPPTGGETLWRLVSHLSLNYLSLAEGGESLRALKEILWLHVPAADPVAEQQIQGIASMACRRGVHRVGEDAWRGFCRGHEIELVFDERRYVGGSTLLFAAVLDRFFALYAGINSFTRLKVSSLQRSGTWKSWPPRSGARQVL